MAAWRGENRITRADSTHVAPGALRATHRVDIARGQWRVVAARHRIRLQQLQRPALTRGAGAADSLSRSAARHRFARSLLARPRERGRSTLVWTIRHGAKRQASMRRRKGGMPRRGACREPCTPIHSQGAFMVACLGVGSTAIASATRACPRLAPSIARARRSARMLSRFGPHRAAAASASPANRRRMRPVALLAASHLCGDRCTTRSPNLSNIVRTRRPRGDRKLRIQNRVRSASMRRSCRDGARAPRVLNPKP